MQGELMRVEPIKDLFSDLACKAVQYIKAVNQ